MAGKNGPTTCHGLTLGTTTITTTSTRTTPTTTVQAGQTHAFPEVMPQLPHNPQGNFNPVSQVNSIDTRLAEVDALCQRLIVWDTTLTEEVNHRGQKILQNERGISNLNLAVAGIQQAQRTNLEDQRVVLSRINAQQETLKLIDQRIASLGRGVAGTPALSKMKLDLPIFSGVTWEPPMRFLSKFLSYIEATGASDYSFKFLVDQAFRPPATDWWEYVRKEVHTVQDFKNRFKQHYWNDNKQWIVKRDLEHGRYKELQSTRSEYVLQLYNQVILLDDPPTEPMIVQCFSKHFDDQIRLAILAQGIKTVSGLITLLDNLDQAGSLNSDHVRSSSVHFTYSESKSAYSSPGIGKSPDQRRQYYSEDCPRRDAPLHSTANSYDNRVRLKDDAQHTVRYDSKIE